MYKKSRKISVFFPHIQQIAPILTIFDKNKPLEGGRAAAAGIVRGQTMADE